jgi:N-acetylneuraminate synthase
MSSVYVIAEAGVNHNGSVEIARKLIDVAKESQADAVKFQTFKTEKILTKSAGMAEYQKNNLRSKHSQFTMLKALELSCADFSNLKVYADSIGIEFLSTPDDEESLDFLVDKLHLSSIKIGSSDISNFPFLRRIAAKQKKIIMSTGMSTLNEVDRAIKTIRANNQQELILLHCTTNYPCPSEEVNLRAMLTLKHAFQTKIGYSDHTLGSEVSVAAVALGAEVIEKHLTLSRKMEGPDHVASLEPSEFSEMICKIRSIEKALGSGVKRPSISEEKIKPMVRKRVVAARELSAGIALKMGDLNFKRANKGIFVEDADNIIGFKLLKNLKTDIPIEWNFLSKKS